MRVFKQSREDALSQSILADHITRVQAACHLFALEPVRLSLIWTSPVLRSKKGLDELNEKGM